MNLMNLNIFTMYEKELQSRLANEFLPKYFNTIINRDKYIFAIGNIPILLVAHMDTFHKIKPKIARLNMEKGILSAKNMGLGADDRAGICAILEILDAGLLPSVLFTQEEEKGCLGAFKAAKELKKEFPHVVSSFKFLIELDRQGEKDAVFYSCGNREFILKILSYGFEENIGSFSDITDLSPEWDVASVNLSIGYSGHHTVKEKLDLKAYNNTVDKVKTILRDRHDQKYDYQEIIIPRSKYFAKYYGFTDFCY